MEKLLACVLAIVMCAASGRTLAQDDAAKAPAETATEKAGGDEGVVSAEEPVGGAPSAEDEANHAELRKLREDLTQAVAAGDVDAQLAHADERIVTTWQNSQVAVGHDGLADFLKQMDGGGQRVFQGYQTPPTADQPAVIYGGDTAIAIGKSVPHYKYLGMEFDLENRWTATLVKEDGQWKIAAYHVSTNVVDNPLLAMAKKSTYWAGGAGLVIGLIAGMLGSRMKNKAREQVA